MAIPTAEEEDTKRPNRERDNLVIEQTRIVNQVKAMLIRFGIRSFRPKARKAEDQLRDLRTAEGSPMPKKHMRGAVSSPLLRALRGRDRHLHCPRTSAWSVHQLEQNAVNGAVKERDVVIRRHVYPQTLHSIGK